MSSEIKRLTTPLEAAVVESLKAGDKVVVHVAAAGGRHFGISVPEEKVIER